MLLTLALRPVAKPVPPPVWRRHEQVVRQLPDPAAAPIASLIERYIEKGEAPEETARVLANERADALATELASLSSRRKRESKVNQILIDQGA